MSSPPHSGRPTGLRWNAWNLLLLVPLLTLFTPLFNRIEPRLFGIPFFYWSQLGWVAVGVLCVAVVYRMTRDEPVRTDKPDRLDVDDLDEGSQQ
ncbi:MAG: DUF3311 domain-containing protein [Pseudonocardiaceae bacterium]|nr:DUF3311 domain-containing protein [Pseudonocardiaceae bacterium]